MAMNNDLKTVPTFNFSQGEYGDQDYEQPINVAYYRNDVVELEQDGSTIVLRIDQVQRLASLIKKYNYEAQKKLSE